MRSRPSDGSPPSTNYGRCWVSDPVHVTFICSGNICRSPMAEKMFAHQITERTGGWHAGDPADSRAERVLRAHDYPTAHAAAAINADHLAADMIVAMGRNHSRILGDLGADPERVRMMRSFDPRSGAHALDVEDPCYGNIDDFEETFVVIEASLPGLHDWVDKQLAERGD
nr:protein tyrosine phosphatase [Mycolicibacterium sp. CBMA 361]